MAENVRRKMLVNVGLLALSQSLLLTTIVAEWR